MRVQFFPLTVLIRLGPGRLVAKSRKEQKKRRDTQSKALRFANATYVGKTKTSEIVLFWRALSLLRQTISGTLESSSRRLYRLCFGVGIVCFPRACASSPLFQHRRQQRMNRRREKVGRWLPQEPANGS